MFKRGSQGSNITIVYLKLHEMPCIPTKVFHSGFDLTSLGFEPFDLEKLNGFPKLKIK